MKTTVFLVSVSLPPMFPGLILHRSFDISVSGVSGPMARDMDSVVKLFRIMTSQPAFDLDPSLPIMPFQEQVDRNGLL